jgi:hypothetical protein
MRRAHRRGRSSHPTAIAVAIVAVVLGSLFVPLAAEAAVEPVLAGCDQADQHLVITVDTVLDPACTYTRGIEITASNVTLDCRGAHIHDPLGTQSRGILITAPTDVALSHVAVRNCEISGFLNNIRVSRSGFKQLVPGQEYEHAFSDIVIDRSRLHDSRGSGIFVDGFVTGVRMSQLDISGSGSVGIYLEAGSADNVVRSSRIHENGFGDVTPDGVPFTIDGVEFRYQSTGREGIAIDGSRRNVIRGNEIWGNSAGAIFLYKNCGEYATEKPAQWWPRYYGAEGNLIRENTIHDERHGVWIGSRMAENQYFMDCSDDAYVSSALRRIHLDMAADNQIARNRFERVDHGVRVEDDGNRVTGNAFVSSDPADQAVLIGTRERTAVLGRPVSDAVVLENTATIPGNAQPFTWIHGHEGTVFARNVANGSAATLGPGVQPTVNPFLFVISAWLAP